MESRVHIIKGNSSEKLLELELDSFDFIYIDGSHKCLDVYLDACLAWKLLKPGGYIVFDDYLFNTGDILGSPKEAIEIASLYDPLTGGPIDCMSLEPLQAPPRRKKKSLL